MDIFSVLSLLGGIGLFLYGMKLLGSSLEKVAGAGLEKTLEKLTSSKIKGVALGALVTGVIQSSAATVIMVVGFVNAGVMKLAQAVPVIMGANIGTTVTAQILRLGDVSSDNLFLQLLRPASFAPVCIAVGAAIVLFSRRKKPKDVASILLGLGILFLGMTTMEATLAPLKDSPAFQQVFFLFENPLLGVALGALVTAVLQSSSASVGVLQAISSTGAVSFSMAAPIIIGQNVGKCVTVILSSLGAKKQAKRAVSIDVMINLSGACIFLAVIYGYQSLVGFSFWDSAVGRGNIADFHTLFNLGTTFLMLPLSQVLIRLSGRLIGEQAHSKIDQELLLLDDRFLNTPSVALTQCRKVVLTMGEAVEENYAIAWKLLQQYDDKLWDELEENERFLDRSETVLGEYLIKITSKNLGHAESMQATEIMHALGDFERMGDYCVNMSQVAQYNREQNIAFTPTGSANLRLMTEPVAEIIRLTVEAMRQNDQALAEQVEPLEEVIDVIQETLKTNHMQRLQHGACSIQGGISFVEVLTDLERISDHCSNVAVHLIQRLGQDSAFDAHAHLQALHRGETEHYNEYYRQYEERYCRPLQQILQK